MKMNLIWLAIICSIPFLGNLFLQNQNDASNFIHKFLQSLQITTNINPPVNNIYQPYRTAYHFQPPKNWMNDPNGPMIYKGIYHLFYQYNPKKPIWEPSVVWAHSTSNDLINWTPQPIALSSSQDSDINGCFSGSTTILPGEKPAILYTGINPQSHQVQNLALPKNLSDPYLIEWIKSPDNPLMSPTLENGINATSFRDPTTAWLGRDGDWRVIIGNEQGRSGRALLYTSKDFVHWDKVGHPLHYSMDSGMWECPDFYPVAINGQDGVDTSSMIGDGIKHVLKVSLFDGHYDVYSIGTYDVEKDVFVPEHGTLDNATELRYDYGKFYGSKSFFDSYTKRRIVWAWINESTDSEIDVKKGWSGLQAIPRKVWLDESGKKLVQWPVIEIEKLRANQVSYPNTVLKGGSVLEISGVTPSQADVEISFEVEISKLENAEVFDPSWTDPQAICSQKDGSVKGNIGPFGLLVLASKDRQEHTAIFFRIFKDKSKYVVLMCSDQSKSSLQLDYDKTIYGAFLDMDIVKEQLSLRSLIDHSIVESFGGDGKACMTARVYPSLAIDEEANLYVFNNGTKTIKITKLSAWSMKKAQIN